jgi:AcrR family transcriptional regulator
MKQNNKLGLRKNLKEQERREAILKSAMNVFAQKGYDRATMDDLVSEAGCSKALVYLYWKNKAELFSDILDIVGGKFSLLIRRFLESPDPFPEKLAKFLQEFLALYREANEQYKVTFHGSLHISADPDENFKIKQETIYKSYIRDISTLFQQGIDQGYLVPDLDVEAMSFMAVTSVVGYIYMTIFDERMEPERALVEPLMRYIIPMITRKDR